MERRQAGCGMGEGATPPSAAALDFRARNYVLLKTASSGPISRLALLDSKLRRYPVTWKGIKESDEMGEDG